MYKKYGVSVWNNSLGYPMQRYNFLKKQVSNMWSITSFKTRNEMGHFLKSVNYYKYWIISLLILWQTQNKIHTYHIPRSIWNRQWFVQSCVLTLSLCILTNFTILYILLYFSPHPWLEIEMGQLFKGLVYSKMSSKSSTMLFLDQIVPHGTTWYTQLVFFEQ